MNAASLNLVKKTHSCVRLERDGRSLVIDPGGFSEDDAVVGADAILVTHEHPDHFDEGRLRAALESDPAVQVWTLRSVAERMSGAFPGRVHTVGHGDTFTAAGSRGRCTADLPPGSNPTIPRITTIGSL